MRNKAISRRAGLAAALPVNDGFGDANVRADVISMFTSLAIPDLVPGTSIAARLWPVSASQCPDETAQTVNCQQ